MDKDLILSLNISLYEVVERLAYIYDKTVEQYLQEAIEWQINGDITNHPDEV